MHPAAAQPQRLTEWQRRMLLLGEVLRELAERVALEHVEAVIAAGRAPHEALIDLGRRAVPPMSRWRAIGAVRDAWLEMIQADPALLVPYETDIAASLALAEAGGRPYREVEHG